MAAEGNLEVVRELNRAFDAGELDRTYALLHPDVVWDVSRLRRFEMVADVVTGHDALRAWWADWLSAWASVDFQNDQHEIVGRSVLVRTRYSGVGRRSGVEIDTPPYWALYDVADGLVTRIRFFEDPDGARREAEAG